MRNSCKNSSSCKFIIEAFLILTNFKKRPVNQESIYNLGYKDDDNLS